MKLLIAVAVIFFMYQKWGVTDASAELNQKYGADVIMYSASWCWYCKKARAQFEQKGIAFKELDIEKSSQAHAEMKSMGGRGVPLFLIKGEVVRGYDMKRVLNLIQAP